MTKCRSVSRCWRYDQVFIVLGDRLHYGPPSHLGRVAVAVDGHGAGAVFHRGVVGVARYAAYGFRAAGDAARGVAIADCITGRYRNYLCIIHMRETSADQAADMDRAVRYRDGSIRRAPCYRRGGVRPAGYPVIGSGIAQKSTDHSIVFTQGCDCYTLRRWATVGIMCYI